VDSDRRQTGCLTVSAGGGVVRRLSVCICRPVALSVTARDRGAADIRIAANLSQISTRPERVIGPLTVVDQNQRRLSGPPLPRGASLRGGRKKGPAGAGLRIVESKGNTRMLSSRMGWGSLQATKIGCVASKTQFKRLPSSSPTPSRRPGFSELRLGLL
jgi:hypothetical protein